MEGSSAPHEYKNLTHSGNTWPSPSLSPVPNHGSAPLSNCEGQSEDSILPSSRVSSMRAITPPGFSSKHPSPKQSFSGIPVQKSKTMQQSGSMPPVGDNKGQRSDTGKERGNKGVEKTAGITVHKEIGKQKILVGASEIDFFSSERIVDASQNQKSQNSPLCIPQGLGTKVVSSGRQTLVGNLGNGHSQSPNDNLLSGEPRGPKTGEPSTVIVKGGFGALEVSDPPTGCASSEEKIEKQVGLKGFPNGRRLKCATPIPNALKKKIVVLEKGGSEEDDVDVDVDVESRMRGGFSFGRDKHEKGSGARWNYGEDILGGPVFIKKQERDKVVDKIIHTVIVEEMKVTEDGSKSLAFQSSEVEPVEVQSKKKKEKNLSISPENRTSLISLGGSVFVEGDKRGGQDEIVDIDSD